MRPAGELRVALLQAAVDLVTPDRGPTLAELAARAGVGREAAMHTVKNLKRAGVLTVPRTRPVSYRNRPVAEYAPGRRSEASEVDGDICSVLQVWA